MPISAKWEKSSEIVVGDVLLVYILLFSDITQGARSDEIAWSVHSSPSKVLSL